jgi:hypothetical protein
MSKELQFLAGYGFHVKLTQVAVTAPLQMELLIKIYIENLFRKVG